MGLKGFQQGLTGVGNVQHALPLEQDLNNAIVGDAVFRGPLQTAKSEVTSKWET